jgi:hypothetical protein
MWKSPFKERDFSLEKKTTTLHNSNNNNNKKLS